MAARLDTRPDTDDDDSREHMYGPHVPDREELDALIRDAREKTERERADRARHEESMDARTESYRALYRAGADHMGPSEMARAVGIPESSFRTYVADLARERRARKRRN